MDTYKCLVKKNPKKDLIKKCAKEFGRTSDPCEGGYLLEDGTFLDFSGKKEGGSPGERVKDHREIIKCIETSNCNTIENHDKFRLISKHGNAIRFHSTDCKSDSPTVDVMLYEDQNPTEKQWQVIRKSAKKRGIIYYDILDKKGNELHEGSFSANKVGKLKSLFRSLQIDKMQK